jgi:hypothetical protein
MSKKRKTHKPTLARARTETAEVSHPRVAGKTEYVVRVMDTLQTMFNRRQITQLQFGAGDRYRTAHDMTSGSAGGAMDFERARGSSGIAPTPALTFLLAAETVSEARRYLYPKDFAIVHRVCVQGFTIEQTAKQLYDQQYDGKWQTYLTEAGRKFRAGLDALADRWWPDAKQKVDRVTGEEVRSIRTLRPEKPVVTNIRSVPQASQTVHATRDKVYRSNDRKRERA